jgi:hypothetical protein
MVEILGTILAIVAFLGLILWLGWWVYLGLDFCGGGPQWDEARKEAREAQSKQLDEEWRQAIDRVAGIKRVESETDRQNDN